MNKIDSIEDVISSVAEIRNLGKGFVTNYYLDKVKHQIWIQKGCFFVERIANSLFFIKKNSSFMNVFYSSASINNLKEDLLNFNRRYAGETLIFDVVEKKTNCEEITDVFCKNGFNEYCSLERLSRINIEKIEPSSGIVYSDVNHVQEINTLLNQYFDVRAEQLPYLDELKEYALNNNILMYLEGNVVAGFVIFEKNNATLYLRYWFVHPEYRNRKIGSKLLRQFFYLGNNSRKQILWVITTNENAIKRYKYYGFKDDNLLDVIYCNKNISYKAI